MFEKIETGFKWLIIIQPKIFYDDRGFFYESYSKQKFEKLWIDCEFVQDNHSKSDKWVFRWLHFQFLNQQDKLIRVLKWSVLDIVVDIRLWSPTFWNYFSVELSDKDFKQLFIPKWFAHWFISIENDTHFYYKVSDYYNPNWENWIYIYDEFFDFDIEWIKKKYWISDLIISPKDKLFKPFNEFKSNFIY